MIIYERLATAASPETSLLGLIAPACVCRRSDPPLESVLSGSGHQRHDLSMPVQQIAVSIRKFGFTNLVLIFEKLTFAHVNLFPASPPCVVVAQRTPTSRP